MFEKLNTAAPTVLLESFDANYDQSIETFKQIAELVSKEDAVNLLFNTMKKLKT